MAHFYWSQAHSLIRSINRNSNIAVTVTGKKQKVSVSGVTLRIFYNIKNPTDTTMRLSLSFIIIVVNGKQVATTNMQVIDIPESSRDYDGKIVIGANRETGEITSEIVSDGWIMQVLDTKY